MFVTSIGTVPRNAGAADAVVPPATKVRLEFDGQVLAGFLYMPEGDGPWPALLWNHGSEKDPGKGAQFATVASVFVRAGYVVFAPERRGHGDSEGDYIVDQTKLAARVQGSDAANRLAVHLLETEQLRDQLAGLAPGGYPGPAHPAGTRCESWAESRAGPRGGQRGRAGHHQGVPGDRAREGTESLLWRSKRNARMGGRRESVLRGELVALTRRDPGDRAGRIHPENGDQRTGCSSM